MPRLLLLSSHQKDLGGDACSAPGHFLESRAFVTTVPTNAAPDRCQGPEAMHSEGMIPASQVIENGPQEGGNTRSHLQIPWFWGFGDSPPCQNQAPYKSCPMCGTWQVRN